MNNKLEFDTKKLPAPWWATGYKCDICGLSFLTAYEWDMRHRNTHDENFTTYRHEKCCKEHEIKVRDKREYTPMGYIPNKTNPNGISLLLRILSEGEDNE